MPTSTNRNKVLVDCLDLDGLRGVASLWIMFFHVLYYSNRFINIQGSTLMPLFFLLSGFTLALGYSGKLIKDTFKVDTHHANDSPRQVIPYSIESQTNIPDNQHNNMEPEHPLMFEINQTLIDKEIPLSRFYYNRFLRILPVYYFCMLFAIPLTYAGFGPLDPSNQTYLLGTYIQNILPVNTWTFFLFGTPFDGPEWTISTLIFFWLLFPWILRTLEEKTNEELLSIIINCFWLQLLVGIILFFIGIILFPIIAFWLATAWPISRLPVFVMGVSAGVLTLRSASTNTPIPWFTHSTGSFLPLNYFTCQVKYYDEHHQIDFIQTIYWQTSMLLIYTIGLTIIQAFEIDTLSALWFQLLNVFAQLEILIALTQLKGITLISKVLRHPLLLWFGELSMALYMVHLLCMLDLSWFDD